MGSNKAWTADEIDYLQEKWGILTAYVLSERLGRTKNAVILKAKRLNLGSFKDNSEYMNVNQWSEILGVDRHAIYDYWIPKLGLRYKIIAPRGIRKFKFIKISTMFQFLEQYQDIFDSRRIGYMALGQEPQWLTEKRERDKMLPTRRNQKWTPYEDAFLCQYIKKGIYSYTEIAQFMNRSVASIKHRVARLDIFGTGRYKTRRAR